MSIEKKNIKSTNEILVEIHSQLEEIKCNSNIYQKQVIETLKGFGKMATVDGQITIKNSINSQFFKGVFFGIILILLVFIFISQKNKI